MFENIGQSSFRVGSARRFQPLFATVALCIMAIFGLSAYVSDALSPGQLPPPARSTIEYMMAHALKDIALPAPPRAPSAKEPVAHQPNPTGNPGPPLAPPDKINPEVERTPTVDKTPGEVEGDPLPPNMVPGDKLSPPPPVVETPKEPVPVGGKIRPPTKVADTKPLYPAVAQAAQVQGIVIIEATIGEDGRVQNARILRSIPLLDAAALDAVRQWQFTPTLLNGRPQAVVMTVTVNFTLQ
jgi:protein TonB